MAKKTPYIPANNCPTCGHALTFFQHKKGLSGHFGEFFWTMVQIFSVIAAVVGVGIFLATPFVIAGVLSAGIGFLMANVAGRLSSGNGQLPPGYYYLCPKCGFSVPVQAIGKYKR